MEQIQTSQEKFNDISTAAAVAAASAAVTATAGIMRELGDIKVAQGKNDTEIKNIGSSVQEIKADVKEIKALYVTHSELRTFQHSIEAVDKDHEMRLRTAEKIYRYGLGALGLAQLALGTYIALKK